MDKYRIRSNEKSGIIFDIGIAYTKIGFTGDNGPIKIIKTPIEIFKDFKDKIPMVKNVFKQERNSVSVFEEQEIEGQKQQEGLTKTERQQIYESDVFIAQSLENCVNLDQRIDCFFNNVFYFELLQKLTNKTIYICKNYFIPHEFYDRVATILFNKYDITKIQFVLNNSLPLYITGQLSGLVVECGYYDSQITPIYEGFPLMNNLTSSKCGGYLINKFLKHYIAKDNPNLNSLSVDFQQLEDIKFKYCKLLLKNQEEQYSLNEDMINNQKQTLIATSFTAVQTDTSQMQLERSTKKEVVQQHKIQLSCFTATKSVSLGLFGNVESDEPNLAYSILSCLSKCDASVAIKICQNIVISGGVASTKGFNQRLRQELLYQLDHNIELKNVGYLKNYISFTKTNYPSSCLPWIGASIVSQLNPSERHSITLDKFRQNSSKLPDVYGNDYLFMLKQNEQENDQNNDIDDII